MKILYVTTVGVTMGFFKSFIRELLDAGHTVDVATNETHGETPIPPCYREWGCRAYPLSCSRSPLSGGNLAAVREIRDLVQSGGYDLVHCHTPVAAACTRLACRKLRRGGVRVFYTAHGFHFYTGAPLKNWLLYYPVEWLCAHWTDVLITINREDCERAKKHMRAKRVEYVPGVGIDTARFMDAPVDRAAKRREIGVPEDAALLLSVGELNGNKNHAVAIRALAKLDDENIHYAIAGAGPLEDELRALADSLGVGGRVHLLGRRSDVAELYRAADLYIAPSLREGLPVAVMEAMASGLPIIASGIRGTNDLLEGGGNIMVAHSDVDAYAAAIRKLASLPAAERETIGGANRARSSAYDTAVINRRMWEIYGRQRKK